MPKTKLVVSWASHKACVFACKTWHYSKSVPIGKAVRVGVWENDEFIGVVMFGRGNNQYQGIKYDLDQTQICELTRVALNTHETPVTKIVSLALKMLKAANPKMLMVFSYADPEQGHHGGIYQAGNWVYCGTGGSQEAFFDKKGKRIHSRLVSASGEKNVFGNISTKHKASEMKRVKLEPKHKYLMPLSKHMRKVVESFRQTPPDKLSV